MPNYRPRDLTSFPGPPDKTLSDNDELQLSRSDGDFALTLKQLSGYVPSTGPTTGSSTLFGLSDVALTSGLDSSGNPIPVVPDLRVMRYDAPSKKWEDRKIEADSLVLQVSTTGSATPADPLAGNPFALPSQAIRWAKNNLRITTSLTLNIIAGTYQEPTGFTVGGDGYLTILQGPVGGGATINDSPGTTGNSGFITAQGRVSLTNVTLTSRRWALYSQRGCSTLITASTITNLDNNQAIQGTDMQIRFSGACLVRGSLVLDNSLSIASGAALTVTTPNSPAITFRGNADCIWGSTATIGFGGTGRTVQIENVSGIRTDSAVWLGNPTFNYITVQPVRSDIAGLPNGSSKVFNMVVVAALPGNPDPNTFYAIP